MDRTLSLVTRAMEASGAKSRRALSQRLGYSPTAITNALQRGSISPTMAGEMAELSGEDIPRWMAIAWLESQPKSPITERLKRAVDKVRNS